MNTGNSVSLRTAIRLVLGQPDLSKAITSITDASVFLKSLGYNIKDSYIPTITK